jgi:DNA invertase Pin-like site-specific DNA recombinase
MRAAQYVRMSTDHQRYSTENQGDGKDSCQILTQACGLDDKPASDEAPARSRFLAVH